MQVDEIKEQNGECASDSAEENKAGMAGKPDESSDASVVDPNDLSVRKASVGELLKNAFPLIISQASMSFLALADTYFMGWIGPEAQAAVGFGGQSVFCLLSLFFGLISGLTTFVSQYFGAKRHSDCGKMLWHMLYLAVGLGILCAIFMGPLVDLMLTAMGTNPDIFDVTSEYMTVRLWACPIMFTAFTFLSFLRGIGNIRTQLIVAILVVVANIPLTYIFAFGLGPIPAFGVAGAAIGTVIAQGLEMLLYGSVVMKRKNALQFATRRMVKPVLSAYANIAKVALPVGAAWAIENWGWLVYNLYITTLPKEQAAANAIVQVFMYVAWTPGLAISIATTMMVGQYMGAKNIKSAEKSAHYAIIMSIVCLLSLGIMMFILRYVIAEAFSDDAVVVDIAVKLFYFAIAYQIFDAAGVTTSGALRGAGDTRFPMLICFIGIWGVMLPMMFILDYVYNLEIYGAWIASSAAIILCGCLYFARFVRGKWKTMFVE